MNNVNGPKGFQRVVSFFQEHWGKLLIVAIIAGITAGIIAGSVKVKVRVKNCAGGTPGFGKGKEEGCLCNKSEECASGYCDTSVVAIASGASQGKCT
jgi:hypothetical protein